MADMNNALLRAEPIKVKIQENKTVQGKSVPMYPISAERECQRIARSYSRILRSEFKEYLPELLKEYKKEVRMDASNDEVLSFRERVQKTFNALSKKLEEKLKGFGLIGRLEKIAKLTQAHSVTEWRKAVKDVTGIDISEDYYKGGVFEQTRQQWIRNLATVLENMVRGTVQQVSDLILDGFRNGKNYGELMEEIQKTYSDAKGNMETLSADQVSTLNSQLTREEHRDAGVQYYIWKSRRDNRVRQSHRAFDGKIYKWDSPPSGWYQTKSRGLVLTGRRCHPGEDYGCRCCAIPVFDLSELTIPVARPTEDVGIQRHGRYRPKRKR